MCCKVYKMECFGVFRGHPRSLAMSPFDREHKTCYSSVIKLCIYLAPLSRYRQLFVGIYQLLPTTPPSGAPVRVTPFEFSQDLWQQKTRIRGLSCSVDCIILHLAIVVVGLVTDTDRHTTIALYRSEHSSRGKNRSTFVKTTVI